MIVRDSGPIGPTFAYSERLHREKYRLEGESFREAMNRVASALADDSKHYHDFRECLLRMRFMPGGRIQAAVGATRRTTPYNCFVSGTIADSFVDGEGHIMQRATEAACTMRLGGGIGYDFSTLRPRGAMIKKLGSKSTGPIAFMHIFNGLGDCTASVGDRRGAQMGVLRVDHPDISEFIFAKQNVDQLNRFNISIAVTDEFMEAVAADKPFDLRWGGQTHATIDARELWESVMRSTWDWAEPGVLFIDRINEMNNLWYCEQIAATNPCVIGDTLLLTDKGHKRIAELAGTTATWWNGEKFVTGPVFSTGRNPIVRVELSDGTSLDCTPYHRFVTTSGLREARELVAGESMAKFDMPVVEGSTFYDGDGYSQGFYQGDGSAGLKKSWVYEPKYPAMARLRGSFGRPHYERKFRVWSHGPMLAKDFVPVDGSIGYCVDWFAGLLDADGTVQHGEVHDTIQLASVDKAFLLRIRLMLTRLGVQAKVTTTTGGSGGFGEPREYSRLLLCAADVQALLRLGLRTERLKIGVSEVKRDKRRFVEVVSVTPLGYEEETFCVTDPENGRATFDGIVTGNCGEQPLPPFAACLLGSFNLSRYVYPLATGNGGEVKFDFDWDQYGYDIKAVVRAMDNIVDTAVYPLPQQEREAKNKRRMGLGVCGLANAVERLGYPYGSKGFVEFQERIHRFHTDNCYAASVELAREKGPFKLFDAEKYCQSKFLAQAVDPDIVADIRKYGIRNSHLTSIAPTGTISQCADNTTSGIEPVFDYRVERAVILDNGPNIVVIPDYGVERLHHAGKRARDVSVQEHLDVLLCAQRFTDSAVSKTCNVPPDTPWEAFKAIYVNAWEGGAKGCTTYQINSKRGAVIKEAYNKEPDPTEEACRYDPTTGSRTCGD